MARLRKMHVHKAVYGIWSLFLAGLLLSMRSHMAEVFLNHSGYIRFMEVCILLGIVLEYRLFCMCSNKMSENGKRAFVFGTALGLRLLSLIFSRYTPTNDFANYFQGACHFAENGFAGGLYEPLDSYGIAEFAGQAVVNGCLLRVLSPTLLGMQVLNCIYTAGICVCIYEIGKKITETAAAAAAVFYTFYPVSILSGHVTTNTHGAAFFLMASVLFFDRAQRDEDVKKRAWNAAACAVSLLVSNFYHPSAVIVVCAYATYIAGCEISDALRKGRRAYIAETMSKIRKLHGNLILTAFILTVYSALSAGAAELFRDSGFIRCPEKNNVMLKVVFGFNENSRGGYSQEDADYLFAYPPEEQNEVCMLMLWERLKDPAQVFNLMKEKTKQAWFGGDNYFYFYADGVNERYRAQSGQMQDGWLLSQKKAEQEKVQTVLSELNIVNHAFVYIMWGLALIGMVSALRAYEGEHIIFLILYIPLGWMLFIMVTEMQSRYRYQGFMVIVILAGYGFGVVKELLTGKKIRKAILAERGAV